MVYPNRLKGSCKHQFVRFTLTGQLRMEIGYELHEGSIIVAEETLPEITTELCFHSQFGRSGVYTRKQRNP